MPTDGLHSSSCKLPDKSPQYILRTPSTRDSVWRWRGMDEEGGRRGLRVSEAYYIHICICIVCVCVCVCCACVPCAMCDACCEPGRRPSGKTPTWLTTKQESSPEETTGCDHPNCPPRTTRAGFTSPMGFEPQFCCEPGVVSQVGVFPLGQLMVA